MTHRTTPWTLRSRVARIGAAPPLDRIPHDARAALNRVAPVIDAWITEDQWCAGFPAQPMENVGLAWWRNA